MKNSKSKFPVMWGFRKGNDITIFKKSVKTFTSQTKNGQLKFVVLKDGKLSPPVWNYIKLSENRVVPIGGNDDVESVEGSLTKGFFDRKEKKTVVLKNAEVFEDQRGFKRVFVDGMENRDLIPTDVLLVGDKVFNLHTPKKKSSNWWFLFFLKDYFLYFKDLKPL